MGLSCTKDELHQVVVAKPPVVAAAPNPSALTPGATLGDQLAAEAAARPPNTTKIERIIEALNKEGLGLAGFQQSVARTHGASYCGNVRSSDLYVLLCEYDSRDHLSAGRPLTDTLFASVPERVITTTQNTSVLLQWLSPAGKAQAAKGVAALEKLDQ
jgi:hypothetical protein